MSGRDSYPPAVLREAEQAMKAAERKALGALGTMPGDSWRGNDENDSTLAGAQAYADVLARHLVATKASATVAPASEDADAFAAALTWFREGALQTGADEEDVDASCADIGAERDRLRAEVDRLTKRVEVMRGTLDELREGMAGHLAERERREFIDATIEADDKAAQS